jgi:hypothetical protein
MMRTLSLLLLIALLPRPAAAQSGRPLEISAGYSFVRDPKNDISLPSGWMVGAALPVSGWLSAVADVSGNRKTVSAFGSDLDFGVHAAMAGVRASARVGKLTEFAQVLAGVVRGSGTAFGFTSTSHALGLQPGFGVDCPLAPRLAARGELDVRFIHNQPDGNNAGYEYRFVGALVYRVRR